MASLKKFIFFQVWFILDFFFSFPYGKKSTRCTDFELNATFASWRK